MRVRAFLVFLALSILPASAEPLQVQASTGVLAWMAERLAGDAVEAGVILPAGEDPATWQPGIAAITAVQGAGLIVLNGAGYEPWASRVSLPRARTVDVSAGLEPEFIRIVGSTHSHGGTEHSHEGVAPQLWLDFRLAAKQAEALARGLTRALPDQSDAIAANLSALQSDLGALSDAALSDTSVHFGQTVLTWQPGFEYFARANGLTLREVTMDAATDTPSPEQLAAVDAAVRETKAHVMLWGIAPPPATVEALEEHGVTAVLLPYGTDQPPGTDLISVWRQGLSALGAVSPN